MQIADWLLKNVEIHLGLWKDVYSGDLLDLPVMTMSLFSTTSRGVFATLHFVNLSHAAVFLSKTVSTL